MDWNRQYNDTYKPHTEMIGNDECFFMELDHHVLRNRREDLGMTQQEVANKAKVQLRQYQRLESGERSMQGASFRIALSVCYALQLDPYRFLAIM